MSESGTQKWPVPNGSDSPNGPAAFLDLATRMSLMLGSGVAIVANDSARGALITNGDVYDGLLVGQVDTHTIYLRTSSTWLTVYEDTGWITPSLGNSWASVSGQTIMYCRKNGVVYLKGRGTGGTTGVAFTLPAGYRPSVDIVAGVATSTTSPPSMARVIVEAANGNVTLVTATTPNLAQFPSFLADN